MRTFLVAALAAVITLQAVSPTQSQDIHIPDFSKPRDSKQVSNPADIRGDLFLQVPKSAPAGGRSFLVVLRGNLPWKVKPDGTPVVELRDTSNNSVLFITTEQSDITIEISHSILHPTQAEAEEALKAGPFKNNDAFLKWVRENNRDEIYQDVAVVKVTGKDPGPDDGDDDDPDDDEPKPDPAPIPHDGFRVLIIEESTDRTKLSRDQLAIILGREVREYLDGACVEDGYRIYDKDVPMDGETEIWKAAMQRRPQSTPWVIVSNGKTGFEGPLPADPKAFIELCRKYEK